MTEHIRPSPLRGEGGAKPRMRVDQGFILCIVFSMFFFVSAAQAALHVDIHGGKIQGIPIAVLPFEDTSGLDEAHDLAAVIRADLHHSGQFEVNTLSKSSQATMQNLAYWKELGVENIVSGSLHKTGSNYSVDFELRDVLAQSAQHASHKPLLVMHFDKISTQHLRALAHHISDRIFEKLMGVKGFFSTRIAYISTLRGPKGPVYTLEIADFDGHHPRPLYRSAFPLMSPAWSHDGRKIAFVSFEKDRASINVVDVLSAKVQRLTQFPGINGAPSWSPDGKTLALVLSKEGTPSIYTLDLADKHLIRLTASTGRDTEPVFAPDGRSVYFTSDRGGKPQIYKVHLATRQTERVTFVGNYNAKPSITPDGKRLVTLHRAESTALFSIALQSLSQGGEPKILTETGLNDSPTLAPNGMMVVYGSGDGEKGVLRAVSLDGRTQITLPTRAGEVKDPAWSPFVLHD